MARHFQVEKQKVGQGVPGAVGVLRLAGQVSDGLLAVANDLEPVAKAAFSNALRIKRMSSSRSLANRMICSRA